MTRFAWRGMRILECIMASPEMIELWDSSICVTSAVNDMLSLKKEIAGSNIARMVLFVYAGVGDAQVAVDETSDFVVDSVLAFEDAAHTLLCSNITRSSKQVKQLKGVIIGCRYYITGHVAWK